MKIFVYGFANTAMFFNEVFKISHKRNEDIEWGIIYSNAPHKNKSDSILKKENILYLYEEFNSYFYNKERELIDYNFKVGSDNIHRMIDGSKHGYLRNNSVTQEKNANIVYEIYKNYLLKNMPDYFIFPDLETADGLILLNLCKELKIEILYTVHTRLLGKSFFAQDAYETLPKYFGDYSFENITESELLQKSFLDNKLKAYMENDYGKESIEIRLPNIYNRFLKGLYNKYKYERNAIIEGIFIIKILKLIPKAYTLYLRQKFSIFQKKYFRIVSNEDKLPENFILFPLQMTPESSINTLEQYFINQERLIDIVRLNMPHNFYLLVKEHPVMIGFRKNSFYRNLSKKSGVILVDSSLDTKEFIKKSKLVVTVTGTVALESYIEDKNTLMFGPSFFSHLCNRFDSYLNVRDTISSAILNKDMTSNKTIEIAKIYNISFDFVLNDPLFKKGVMKIKNINNFINAIKLHIERIKNV